MDMMDIRYRRLKKNGVLSELHDYSETISKSNPYVTEYLCTSHSCASRQIKIWNASKNKWQTKTVYQPIKVEVRHVRGWYECAKCGTTVQAKRVFLNK